MPDEIQPALTPDEWRAWVEHLAARTPEEIEGRWRVALRASAIRDRPGYDRSEAHALMALANAALPDGDPRKISWNDWKGISAAIGQLLHVTAGQDESSWWVANLRETAAKLAALLPPNK